MRVEEFTDIRYAVAGGVATVTIDRPERMNSLPRPHGGRDDLGVQMGVGLA